MEMSSISKNYSGVPALKDVSLEVRSGEVHALLGENGAGKSTLMNVATGTVAPTAGQIIIDGKSYSELTPSLAASLGIAIVHQHPAVLPDLTVLENFLVALSISGQGLAVISCGRASEPSRSYTFALAANGKPYGCSKAPG
jgi:ribose transport system ATP-binding protein